MLKDCNMDTRESAQRLFYTDVCHEVKRKRDRREVGRVAIPRSSLMGYKNRSPSSSNVSHKAAKYGIPSVQFRGARGGQGNCSTRYVSDVVAAGPATVAVANSTSLPENASVLEESTLKLDTKLEKLNIPPRQHVVFPDHFQVPKDSINRCTFGSLDDTFGGKDCRSVVEFVKGNSESARKPSLSNQSVSSTAEEGDCPDHTHVLENLAHLEDDVSSGSVLKHEQSKQEMVSPLGGVPTLRELQDAKYLEEVLLFNLRLDKIKGVMALITQTTSCIKDFHTKWNNDKKEKFEEKGTHNVHNEISAILKLCQDIFQSLEELVLRTEDIKGLKVESKEPSLEALKIVLRQLEDVPSFDIVGYEPATSKDSQWEKPDPEDIEKLKELKIEERILVDRILFYERHLKAADEKAANESSEDPQTSKKNEEKRELVKLFEEKLRKYRLDIEDLEKRIPKDIEGLQRDQHFEEVGWEGQIKLEFLQLEFRAKMLLKELDDNDVQVKDNDGIDRQ